jgi:hypothetical protein
VSDLTVGQAQSRSAADEGMNPPTVIVDVASDRGRISDRSRVILQNMERTL